MAKSAGFAWVLNIPDARFENDQMARSDDREDAIAAALAAVDEGQSIRSASKAFSVPYSTLQDHVAGKLLMFCLYYMTVYIKLIINTDNNLM